MTAIHFQNQRFELQKDQSVLEGLTSQGVPIPYSCRAGVCQTCMMKLIAGELPPDAQGSLKDTLKATGHFLSCICKPEQDLEVAFPDDVHLATHGTVRKLELLNHDTMLVELEPQIPLDYKAGQFINLVYDQIHVRSYSLASVKAIDKYLQLHVRRLPEGKVSGWIHEEWMLGHQVEIRGPNGDCFYVPGKPDQPLLLIGTGSGLAPLYGILRDALLQGHQGDIHLYHGSRDANGLYLLDELRTIQAKHSNFHYHPCLSGQPIPHGFTAGRVHEVALKDFPNLKSWRLFLCGHPEMVKATKKKAYLAGASLQEILADAFNIAHA